MLYELDPRKHSSEHQNYQWVVPVDSIIGKLPATVVSVGDTGTIPYSMAASFLGAHGDSSPDAGNGCRVCQLMGAWLVPRHLIKAAFPRGIDGMPAAARILFTGIIV